MSLNVFAGSDGSNNLTKKKNSNKETAVVKDCFETINRGIFAFNQGIDKVFLNQLLKATDIYLSQSDQEQVMH